MIKTNKKNTDASKLNTQNKTKLASANDCVKQKNIEQQEAKPSGHFK